MLFSLEALSAYHGEGLLLHYGTTEDRRLVLIDGGPPNCMAQVLAPRLGQLVPQTGDGVAPLELELIMVSHFDDDHIRGVADLLGPVGDVADWALAKPAWLWLNTFADLLDESDQGKLQAGLARLEGMESFARAEDVAIATYAGGSFDTELMLAASGIGQAMDVRERADELGIKVNDGANGLVMAPSATETLPGGLELTVVAPDAERIELLRELWRQEADRPEAFAGDFRERMAAELARYADVSPTNLASIVALARFAGRTMLLTGDARGDHILDGLRKARLLGGEAGQTLDVDVLKVQHHGSSRNVEADFFAAVRAGYYVISANGKYGNPDTATLELIRDSRSDDDFTIVLTNHDSLTWDIDERLDAFVAERDRGGRSFGVQWRTDPALSIVVDLGEPAATPRP
jgi:hypothetical protein